jgi:pseudouridine-5'-monophosphatase
VICGDDPILLGKGKPGSLSSCLFVVTSASAQSLELIPAVFATIDPTIFLEAAKLLSLTTPLELSRCLVFEDGAPGVRAGLSAGMQVCWVPEPELLEIMNEMKDPTFLPSLTLSSVEHFMPHEWGLPHYDAIVAVESRM